VSQGPANCSRPVPVAPNAPPPPAPSSRVSVPSGTAIVPLLVNGVQITLVPCEVVVPVAVRNPVDAGGGSKIVEPVMVRLSSVSDAVRSTVAPLIVAQSLIPEPGTPGGLQLRPSVHCSVWLASVHL